MLQRHCRFCEVSDTLHSGELSKNFYDRPLLETENFFVVPSLGALVEGWLLIVSKKHYISMGALSDTELTELNYLCAHLKRILEFNYGPVAIFEHGPVQEKLLVGCGVDHAHIHLVPTKLSLAEEAQKLHMLRGWVPVSGLNKVKDFYNEGKSYLYVDQTSKGSLIYTGEGIPSQLFRQIIATYSNQGSQFKWKEYPHYDNIIKTLNRLQTHLFIDSNCKSAVGGI